jgi:hypothetical protein
VKEIVMEVSPQMWIAFNNILPIHAPSISIVKNVDLACSVNYNPNLGAAAPISMPLLVATVVTTTTTEKIICSDSTLPSDVISKPL